jgi:hypothetical protein
MAIQVPRREAGTTRLECYAQVPCSPEVRVCIPFRENVLRVVAVAQVVTNLSRSNHLIEFARGVASRAAVGLRCRRLAPFWKVARWRLYSEAAGCPDHYAFRISSVWKE